MITWDYIYTLLNVRDFIYFVSSSQIQDMLLPVKLIFVLFSGVFLILVVYFYINSSYIEFQFLQDITEFLSWQAYGLRETTKRWNKIKKKIVYGTEAEYKLAIIEADDFLYKTLEDRGFDGETFEELVEKASRRMIPNSAEVLEAHEVRNSIIYEPDYELNTEEAKQLLSLYESTIKNIVSA